MNYKSIVESIKNLAWEKLSAEELKSLLVLSAFAAWEFGSSLRIARSLFPENKALEGMADEELATTNLVFGDYRKAGDHADFLWHFIGTSNLRSTVPAKVFEAGRTYVQKVNTLSDEVRAMSIVSREAELPGIFERILEAPDWTAKPLDAFRYYLEQHIALDSKEGGHADMLSKFPVDEQVAKFYEARLEMYRCLSTLFGKGA